ncbi:GDSL esterase/lipase 7-like [Tasmannia lanceolata]|uniref:GDSL esterase/lipase 7-like n=1 Tax=Tasmannia lanceolata TaxID=3420 RepID=UPI004064577E
MRSSLSIVFLNLLLQSFFAKSDPLAPALYIFGDSLLDNGNHNHQVTEAKANYEPYGVDFPGGATGRFTNGKTYADILGEELGLPFAPPYFGLSDDEKAKTSTGVNYASAGSGFLDETRSQMGPCFSFNQQLDFFQKTLEVDLRKQFTSPKALSHYLSKAIFMVSLGGNDYLSNYLQPNFYNSSKLYTLEAFTELLHEKLSQGLQGLVLSFEIPESCM